MGAEFLIIKLCLDCVIKFLLEPSSSMCVGLIKERLSILRFTDRRNHGSILFGYFFT